MPVAGLGSDAPRTKASASAREPRLTTQPRAWTGAFPHGKAVGGRSKARARNVLARRDRGGKREAFSIRDDWVCGFGSYKRSFHPSNGVLCPRKAAVNGAGWFSTFPQITSAASEPARSSPHRSAVLGVQAPPDPHAAAVCPAICGHVRF